MQIVDKQYSKYVSMDMVFSQNVNRGKIIKIENVVEVVVSGGREPVVIPDMCGYQKESAQEALAELEALGYVVSIGYEETVAGIRAYVNGYEYQDNNGIWCYRHLMNIHQAIKTKAIPPVWQQVIG